MSRTRGLEDILGTALYGRGSASGALADNGDPGKRPLAEPRPQGAVHPGPPAAGLPTLAVTAALILPLLLSAASCKRRATAEDAPKALPAELLSSLELSDPRASVQLTRGFYGLEGGSWSWTASRFGVVLAPPEGARERGARLELKFSIPDAIFEKLGPMTVRCSFNGETLEPETFSQPGEHVYARDIPAALFGGDAASIEFTTDESLPPGAVDQRELALVVSAVGLQPK